MKFRFFIEEVVSPCISFIRLELFKEGAIVTDFSKLFERVDLHLAVRASRSLLCARKLDWRVTDYVIAELQAQAISFNNNNITFIRLVHTLTLIKLKK